MEHDSPPGRAGTTCESATKRTWLLEKIETYGFGGLNTSSRQRFDYEPNTQSICLEGPNGSGKSSLTAAITWSLTGHRVHEQVQPSDSTIPQPVLDKQGRTVASWPPLAVYPNDLHSMGSGAKVGVKLTFYDFHTGEEATAVRRRNADGQVVCEIDPLMPFIEWRPTPDHNVEVLNDTADLYRYFDCTQAAEFLYAC